MNSAPLLPARLDWPSAIGNFILNFGHLEYLSFVCLRNILTSSEFEDCKALTFKDRVSKIKKHLRESGSAKENQEQLDLLVKRLEPLRKFRNRIAHGYLLFRFDDQTQPLSISISQPKDLDSTYSPDTRHIEFEELRANLSELTELIEAFKKVAGF